MEHEEGNVKDGIYIPAWLVRISAVAMVLAAALVAKEEYPQVRRYLKAELM